MAGQPGESGEINVVIPDPDNQDKVFIGRGYDYGNVSVSTDAGVTFSILQGHNNVAKTGNDAWSFATITIDFVAGLLINKHYFLPPMSMNLDGSNSTQINFPGVPTEGLPVGGITTDIPVRGLQKRAGGILGRYTADGGFIYSIAYYSGAQPPYYAAGDAPGVSSAVLINGVTLDDPEGRNLLAHPTDPCTWVVQTGGTAFSVTRNCGATWSPLPMDGFASNARVVAVAYFPDASGKILAFTEDGRRFLFSGDLSNSPPIANAGANQSACVNETVTLDGSGSTDVDGDLLTYTWAFTSKPDGSTATLSDAHAVNPTFTVDEVGTYVVSLIVNDGTVDSAPDIVSISTINMEFGIITTVAGNGEAGYSGDGGPAIEARLNGPFGMAMGADGSLMSLS
ncbi:MAG: PKD domain-containing protein [Candidatus Brocadia sinica]|nr:PKD domain-containing protein [Candidatus Brocadia sinica]NUO06942.1 hypothetical protein [Candidatus Brocadia sinica]